MRHKIALLMAAVGLAVIVPTFAWSQSNKIDVPESKRAINKKITEDEAHIAELNKRIERKRADKLDVSDLEQDVEREKAKIEGKKEILKAITDEDEPVMTTEGVDELIQKEQDSLDKKKEELEGLRKKEPKPRKEIDALQNEVNNLAKKIEGKKEAKGALVTK